MTASGDSDLIWRIRAEADASGISAMRAELARLNEGLTTAQVTTTQYGNASANAANQEQQVTEAVHRHSLSITDLVMGYQQLSAWAQQGWAALNQAAREVGQREAFQELAQEAGMSAQAVLDALSEAAAGTVDMQTLMSGANRILVSGMNVSAEQMSQLMLIARDRARAMGLDTVQAFNDIVTGIVRGSPLILDNLGIITKLGEAHQEYADRIGTTVEALTSEERAFALLDQVIRDNAAGVADLAGQTQGVGEEMAAASASVADLGDRIANLATQSGAIEGLSNFIQDFTDRVWQGVTGVIALSAAFQEWIDQGAAREVGAPSGVAPGSARSEPLPPGAVEVREPNLLGYDEWGNPLYGPNQIAGDPWNTTGRAGTPQLGGQFPAISGSTNEVQTRGQRTPEESGALALRRAVEQSMIFDETAVSARLIAITDSFDNAAISAEEYARQFSELTKNISDPEIQGQLDALIESFLSGGTAPEQMALAIRRLVSVTDEIPLKAEAAVNSMRGLLETTEAAAADLSAALGEADEQMVRRGEEVKDELEGLQQDIIDGSAEFYEDMGNIGRRYQEKQADITRQGTEKTEDAWTDYWNKQSDQDTKFRDTLADLNRQYLDVTVEDTAQTAERLMAVQVNYSRRLEDFQSQDDRDRREAIRNRDARSLDEANRARQGQQQSIEVNHRRELQDVQTAEQQQTAARQREQTRRIRDAEIAHQREERDLDTSIARQLQDIDVWGSRARALAIQQFENSRTLRLQSYQQERADLEAHLRDMLALRQQYDIPTLATGRTGGGGAFTGTKGGGTTIIVAGSKTPSSAVTRTATTRTVSGGMSRNR